MIKKILSFIMAILITCTVMLNSFKADAVAVPASLLAYLIQACAEVLVGSGAVTQNDFNKMSTSDVFDMTKQVAPSINVPIPDLGYYLMKFIAQHPESTLPYSVWDILRDAGFRDFIFDNADNLESVPNFDMKGYSSVAFQYSSSGYILNAYYGYNGELYDLKEGDSVSFYLPYSVGYHYFSNGDLAFTYENSSVSSIYHFHDSLWILGGNWVMRDGSAVPDGILSDDSHPSSIGTVDVDGDTYDVNGDGTVNIDDKTYIINDDGSITIDDKTYYPDYDLSNYDIKSLIDLLLSLLDNIDVTDDTTDDLIDDSDVDVSEAIVNSELSSLTMPKTIATVFPFCIPWDFYHGIKLLSEKPVAPRFEVPFELPAYKSFPGFKKMIVIDFEEYATAFAVVRWTMFTIFMFGLCFITFKIVKGA